MTQERNQQERTVLAVLHDNYRLTEDFLLVDCGVYYRFNRTKVSTTDDTLAVIFIKKDEAGRQFNQYSSIFLRYTSRMFVDITPRSFRTRNNFMLGVHEAYHHGFRETNICGAIQHLRNTLPITGDPAPHPEYRLTDAELDILEIKEKYYEHLRQFR